MACGEQKSVDRDRTESRVIGGRVDAEDYSAFYLWSGVKPPPAMDRAQIAYILWGELRRDNPGRIIPLLRTVPSAKPAEKWLVVRAERLDWSDSAFDQLLAQTRQWQSAGPLTGIQVDFDSSTGGLGNYAVFLEKMRGRLPDDVKLSATGLMDWPVNASDKDLAAMRGALDEIVIQTYQKTETIADYPRYLAYTKRLQMPYRVALAQGGEWQEPEGLPKDPNFRGYVVFLINENQRSGRDQKP